MTPPKNRKKGTNTIVEAGIINNNPSARQSVKALVERALITSFMDWATNGKPLRYLGLDRDKSRSRPDYAFYFGHGVRYTVELERWLPPNVRRLESQANQRVSKILEQKLPGIFIWSLPIELFPDGEITPNAAKVVVSEIRSLALELATFNTQPLSLGILTKISNSGNKLVVQVMGKEPLNVARYPRLMRSLKVLLEEILAKAEKKFYRYRGVRVLLLSVEQSGLDLDYHARRSKYSEGIIRRWIQERIGTLTRIDYVCVAQGIRVWHGADTRILTGHKYVDQPQPSYEEVWRRPGLPRILDSLSVFLNKPVGHA